MTKNTERKALEIGQAVRIDARVETRPASVLHIEGDSMVLVREDTGATHWFRGDASGYWEHVVMNPGGGRFSSVKRCILGLVIDKEKAA